MQTSVAFHPFGQSCRRSARPTSVSYRSSLRPARRLRTIVKADGGSDQKAEDAQKKLEAKKQDIQGQLDGVDNMTVDGNFEAKEIDSNKGKLEGSLKDLESLEKELKDAVKSDKKD